MLERPFGDNGGWFRLQVWRAFLLANICALFRRCNVFKGRASWRSKFSMSMAGLAKVKL